LGLRGHGTEKHEPSLIGDIFGGMSKLELLVLSYHFRLGLCNWDHLIGVRLSGDGAGGCYCRHPIYKLPIACNIFFFGTKPKNGCWLN